MRASRRKAKPGQVIVYYGRIAGEAASDIVYSWGGEGASKRHGNNVMWGFTGMRYERNFETGHFEIGDSFVQQLEKAGFDISTLRFSISVKRAPEQPSA